MGICRQTDRTRLSLFIFGRLEDTYEQKRSGFRIHNRTETIPLGPPVRVNLTLQIVS
jgi:hypothetical protein